MIEKKEKTIRKALVTGGAGFIGSHIVEKLVSMGVETVSVDNYSAGKRENLQHLKGFDNFHPINCDVLDYYHLNKCFDLFKFDVIFHQAASKKSVCLIDPRKDLDVNAKGTFNLLELSVKHGVRKFVHASTGSVYGKPVLFPQDEGHPLNPISYYGVSKLAGERYVEAFNRLYGLDTTILRYFHVYGPRQAGGQYGGVVAIFITNILAGLPVFIHGDGSQERSFTYVDDIVEANLAASKSPLSSGKVYNCASGLRVSVLDLYRRLAEWAKYERINCLPPRHTDCDLGEVFKFDVSNEKVKKDLGLSFVPLEEGLKQTVSWFQSEKRKIECNLVRQDFEERQWD